MANSCRSKACLYSAQCPFFNSSTGYSPELYDTMRSWFCFGQAGACARFKARASVPFEFIPDSLLPTEDDRVPMLVDWARLVSAGAL